MFRHRGSVSPIPQSGLSLWLKADAGVTIFQTPIITQVIVTGFTGIYSGANGTYNGSSEDAYFEIAGGAFYIDGNTLWESNYGVEIATNNNNYQGAWTPSQYFSTITLSNAGTTSANGVYTRADSQIDMRFVTFSKSGGSITWDDDSEFWYTSQDLYRNFSSTFDEDWSIENGNGPQPDASYSTSARNVGSPTSTTTIISNPVESWTDQSGNGRNVFQNSNYANTSMFGGKSFLSFPDNTYLTSFNPIWPSTSTIDYGTIIVVARFPSSYQVFAPLLFNHGNLFIGRGNDQTYPDGLIASKDNDVNIFGNSNLSNNTNYLIGMTFNLDSLNLYLNGSNNGSGANFENNGQDEFSIGFNGEAFSMAEIVVYNRVLTTPERQQVEAYLNTKYAIY